MADKIDFDQLQKYLAYDQETLLRLVGVAELPEVERHAATVVAIDPRDVDALRTDGFLPDGVPSPGDLYDRGRQRVDRLLRSNEQRLREVLCPRWDELRRNTTATDLAPPAVALAAQLIGVAEPVTGTLVLLAVLVKYELNDFCESG